MMDTKRDLWAKAYRYYQEQCKMLEAGVSDLAEYFVRLAVDIAALSKETDEEGAALWNGVYAMLERRAKGTDSA